MEVAAERIRSVKKLLPERPHHLALSLGRKYPRPEDFWLHQSPLQYSTFLSDADRGLLLTRPYYDICDEPEAPLPTRQSTPLAGAKKTGNKMTLEVWKSKKVATSPTENGVLGKMDDKKQRASAHGPEKDASRKEQDKVKQAGMQRDSKGQDARGNGDLERSKSSLSKIATREAPSPSSEGKKRPLEQDESTRPHKKTKPSEPQSSEVPRKPPRPETPSTREHVRPWPKERSLSAEDTPPPANKRPRGTEPIAEPGVSSVATKRPRAPETTGSKAPYTPPKPPTANSLSAPGGPQTQTQTPGGRVAQTPGAGDATQSGREGAAKETLRRRWDEFCKIGKKLKHKRDKEFPANGAGPNAGAQPRDYRRAMLTIEMILAYMIAFRSLNQRSEISGAAMEMASWLTLEPHLRELKQMARHSTSLQALAYQLHGIVINELIRAYAYMGLHGGEQLKLGKDQHMAVFQAMKNNPRIWTEANDLRGKVPDKSLRTPTMGNWTTPHKAASDALLLLARFAEREHVNWRAEVVVPNEVA
ncbi:hypothetical protein UCDDA912_g02659 [Diaporthe ampelina]|uniref:Uncharacterized protein n=1 Tax=Diaporthe ampelina TaxID=1214573 RepID=A0A0G2FTP7_9PEZI|nr:hypothetical protein UCDDA912_g02659 [Diaporthe ampelina]